VHDGTPFADAKSSRMRGSLHPANTRVMAIDPRHPIAVTYKWARRIVIAVVGFTVLAIGVAMLVLPGPAVIVIPMGLAILGVEFAWARHWLNKVKEGGRTIVQRVGGKGPGP
jgi:Putative transmembrane protein (PGPGW)